MCAILQVHEETRLKQVCGCKGLGFRVSGFQGLGFGVTSLMSSSGYPEPVGYKPDLRPWKTAIADTNETWRVGGLSLVGSY